MAIFSILTEPFLTVNGVNVRPLLLGDGAYPLLPWLLKPCPINAILNRSQRRFNKTLSSARSTVERLLQFLKVDGEFSLKRQRADYIMFQKLFLPFVKKQGKILVMTKFYRGSSLLREYLQTRDQQSIGQNPVAQDIRQSIERQLL